MLMCVGSVGLRFSRKLWPHFLGGGGPQKVSRGIQGYVVKRFWGIWANATMFCRGPRGREAGKNTDSHGRLSKLWSLSIIIRHLMSRVPKKDHNFDNHPYLGGGQFKVELEPQGKVSEKLSQPPKSQ